MSQEASAKKEEDAAPEVGEMKKGDYMIHVYIQEGKTIKGDNGYSFLGLTSYSDTVSPMIQVTCGTKAKYTSCKKDVGPTSSVYWGEHLFFERNNVSKNEIETSQIQIRILNKGFVKDQLLGAYDFDVTFVYFQPKHTMFNSWIAFSNPEGKDFNEITGYLKLAISIAGPGDEQVALNDETGPQNADEQDVMMPPSIRKEYKQLKIRFVKAEKLPKMDQFGTIDAYIQTVYFKKKLKTKPVTQTKTHETFLEQEFWLPIQWPLASDRLVLKVYDEDKVSDEIVGSMNFSLKKMITESGQDGVLCWHNLYGSPLGCSGDNTNRMNEFPEIASTWKGRILMHIQAYDTKNPEMKLATLDPEFKNKCMKEGAFNLEEFDILAEFGSGICLPGNKKYKVRIQINDFIIDSSDPVEQKGNYNRWSNRTAVTTFKGPYKSVQDLGRIYIYLCDGSDQICFWTGKASDFLNPDPQVKWIPLQCDLAKGKVTNSWEAGLISVKIAINHRSKNGVVDYAKFDAWKKPPPKRLSSWKIRCFIFQCKDIPSADSDGTSDPYISIWNPDNKKIRTFTVEDNNNPIFYQALEIYYDFDKLENAPPIVLNIWDEDANPLDPDDYLGRCVVYLPDAAKTDNDQIPEPKWHDIKLGFSDQDPACGQMLVSFTIVADDYSFKIPIEYLKLTDQIEYNEFNCEINVLGLRNVESFGLMPVKKPFIKFNLRSLLPPEKAQAVTNIKTQPNAAGPNPNINTMISFAIDLPVNPLFCPRLQCDVFDYVYKGLVQPLLGTFTLPIGDIMHQIKQEREDELREAEDIIKFLEEFAQRVQSDPSFMLEDSNKSQFDRRVAMMNQLASIQEDNESTNLKTEAGDKESLIGGPSTQQIEEELKHGGDDEESKKLLEETKEMIPSKSPLLQKSASKTPNEFSPQKLKKKAGTLIFKTQDSQMQQDLSAGLNFKLMLEKFKSKEEMKEKGKMDRQLDLQRMKSEGLEAHKNVIYPKYVYEDRIKIQIEASPKPPNTVYFEVGFDKEIPENPEDGMKHYRRFYDDELENIPELFPKKAFHTVDIMRGQSRGLSKGWFSFFVKQKTDDSGQNTNEKVVGQFKGRINIENPQDKDAYKRAKDMQMKRIYSMLNDIHQQRFGTDLGFKPSDLDCFEQTAAFELKLEKMGITNNKILNFIKDQSYEDLISRMLLIKTKCVVRLYVLEGYDFAQRDIGSFSDPYLKIRCGAKKFNDRDQYQLDEPNPKFNKCYEFDAEFPGASPLVIKAYDFDDLFGDDLIGKTVIDLDDRFFNPIWQQIEDKPIEYRQLYHPSSEVSQGVIKLWLEIHQTTKTTKGMSKTWDLTPQPILDYEVRLVIFDTKDTLIMDAEGTSDVFVKAFVDDKDKKETDTHYRCSTKKASFNYRLLFNVKAPRKNYNLTLQTWDRDLFKSNDFIGENQLPLQHLFEDAIATQKPINLNKKYYNTHLKAQLDKIGKGKLITEFYDEDSFYVDTVDKDGKSAGKVRIGLAVYPGAMALSNPVGGGRSEPNHSPFLPPPVGRLSFSFNPITMFNQLVGPELRRKVYLYCCIALCAMLCIALIPLITGNIVSAGIMKIFS